MIAWFWFLCYNCVVAGLVKLVDTQDLGSCAVRRVGSSPMSRTLV